MCGPSANQQMPGPPMGTFPHDQMFSSGDRGRMGAPTVAMSPAGQTQQFSASAIGGRAPGVPQYAVPNRISGIPEDASPELTGGMVPSMGMSQMPWQPIPPFAGAPFPMQSVGVTGSVPPFPQQGIGPTNAVGMPLNVTSERITPMSPEMMELERQIRAMRGAR